jgi:hypothetical protein
MTAVIPARFLFHWSWPVRRTDELPRSGGQPLTLSDRFRCVTPGAVDGATEFAEIRLAWNPAGFGISVEVRGKKEAVECHPLTPTTSDGVSLWIDTRHTQTVHRATRYCHQFCALPAGAGPKKQRPSVTKIPLGRSGEESPIASAKGTDSSLGVWSQINDDGYLLELWIPAESLAGFDPDASRQLGFYALVRDAELGEQFLTVGREFPFEHDPSLWQNLELCDD